MARCPGQQQEDGAVLVLELVAGGHRRFPRLVAVGHRQQADAGLGQLAAESDLVIGAAVEVDQAAGLQEALIEITCRKEAAAFLGGDAGDNLVESQRVAERLCRQGRRGRSRFHLVGGRGSHGGDGDRRGRRRRTAVHRDDGGGGGEQDIVDRAFRHRRRRDQGRRAAASEGLDRADGDLDGPPRDGRAQTDEAARRKIAEDFGLLLVHAQQVGGAGHVDVEQGAAHQEIGAFGGDVLGQLGQALGGDNAAQTALAATAHQIDHGGQSGFTRVVRAFGAGGGEDLRLVDEHQHRMPMFAVGVEQAAQEAGGLAHLSVDIGHAFQVEHGGIAVLADPGADLFHALGAVILRGDHHMAEAVGQLHIIAFGVDDDLLDIFRRLLDQAAQQVRFARTGIALHQQPRCQQLLEVQRHGDLRRGGAQDDIGHARHSIHGVRARQPDMAKPAKFR